MRKQNKDFFLAREIALESAGPIFFKKEPKSFLQCFVWFYMQTKATYYKDGRKQCCAYANRSRQDGYLLFREYFDITFEQFWIFLWTLEQEHRKKLGYNVDLFFFCPDIHKYVHSRGTIRMEILEEIIEKLEFDVRTKSEKTRLSTQAD